VTSLGKLADLIRPRCRYCGRSQWLGLAKFHVFGYCRVTER
jgi:hypothetical protein